MKKIKVNFTLSENLYDFKDDIQFYEFNLF